MSTPPVVSTITVAGKTYSVTWSGDQRSNPNNKALETGVNQTLSLEWSKPVIKDNKGKAVAASFAYRVEVTSYDWLSGQSIVQNQNTTANKLTLTMTMNDYEIGLSSVVSVKVYATAIISKISSQLGYSLILNTTIGCKSVNSFRQTYSSQTNSPVELEVVMQTALPYDGITESSWTGFEQYVAGAFDPVIEYREIVGSKPGVWKNANIPSKQSMYVVNMVPFTHPSAVRFTVTLPDALVNKVYELRFALNVPNTVKRYQNLTFTPQPMYDNVIAVGDELVNIGYPSTVADEWKWSLPAMLNNYSSSISETARDGGTFYKTGAKIADLPALIRSIPKQPANKKTLLVVNIGMNDVAKVAPGKMISSTSFKSTLKSALTAFLTNNPNATIALFPCPVFNTDVSVYDGESNRAQLKTRYDEWFAEKQAVIENGWNTFVPNIMGVETPQWVKDTAASKLLTYTSVMVQLTSELNTSTRKRVVMASAINDPFYYTNVYNSHYDQYLDNSHLTLGFYDYPLMGNNDIVQADYPGNEALLPDGFHLNGVYLSNVMLAGMSNAYPITGNGFTIGDVVYY